MLVGSASLARTLALCLELEGREQAQLEDVLMKANEPLEQFRVDPSLASPLVRSGSEFTHLPFLETGTVEPWQLPPSELEGPFLIGAHEFVAGAERWVATYSAKTTAHGILIPVRVMRTVVARVPSVETQMQRSVMRRLSRFYWTSLTTSGTPASRVAAALVSRLALYGEDYNEDGKEKIIRISQRDLERLTMTSRSVVSVGLKGLTDEESVIRFGDTDMRKDYEERLREVGAMESDTNKKHEKRFHGVIVVPDVDRLKDRAFEAGRKTAEQPLSLSPARAQDGGAPRY